MGLAGQPVRLVLVRYVGALALHVTVPQGCQYRRLTFRSMMNTDAAPGTDWTALGRAFEAAYAEVDALSLLSRPEEPISGLEVVDADEPEGADEERARWSSPVAVRDLFAHEAADFTPWLAKNLDVVQGSAAIQEPLELICTEKRIAGYRIDILAKTRVAGRERHVVIENQLEKSDADHLGRLISCATESEASHAIWITTGFHASHLKVMESLRKRHPDDCEYIPLQINCMNAGFTCMVDLLSPATAPSESDPLRHNLHRGFRDAQRASSVLDLVDAIRSNSNDIDMTRYRHIVEKIAHWSDNLHGKAKRFLDEVPQQRRTQVVS